MTSDRMAVAHLVDPSQATLDLLGPTLQLLTPPDAGDDAPCLMRGTIPPGVVIPLHSHPEPETFLAVSGEIEGFSQAGDGEGRWLRIRPGDVFHVPGGAKHAFRNVGGEPAVSLAVSTCRLARFFTEVGLRSPPPGPPSAARLQHFLDVADRYGYWNATPEENARIGLVRLPTP
jgi:quercetin dioxygenase-like cupin family protein